MAPATAVLLTRLLIGLVLLFCPSLARAATAAGDGQPAAPPASYAGKAPPAHVDHAKALGLDTPTPGTYRVTGVYAERAGADGICRPRRWARA